MSNSPFGAAWRTLQARPRFSASSMALGYIAFGIAWIAGSDRLLLALSPDMAVYASASQGKGFAFVLATGALVYALAARPWADQPTLRPPRPPLLRPLVWAVLLLAVAIIAAGLAAASDAAERSRQQSLAQLRGLASMRAASLAEWIGRRSRDGNALARDPKLRELYRQWRHQPDAQGEQALRDGLAARLLASRFSDAWLVDSQGRPLLALRGGPSGIDAAALGDEAAAVLHARAPRLAHVRWAGTPDAALQRLDLLVPLYGGPGPGDGDAVLLLRAEPPRAPAPATEGVRLSVRERRGGDDAAAAATMATATTTTTAAGPAELLEAARSIDGSAWEVIAQMPREAADAQARAELVRLGTLDLFALLMAAALAYALRQRQALQVSQREQDELRARVRGWQLLQAIADSSADAIYAKDRDGHYLFANRETCRLLGRSAEQLAGHGMEEVFTPAEAGRLQADDEAALRAGRPLVSEVVLDTVDGERTYLCTKGPLLGADGDLLGVFGISRDITERRHREARHRQWAMAFENIRDGVMITDTEGRIQMTNPAFSEITGYGTDEAIGATPRLLQSGRQSPAFYRQMWGALLETGTWHGEIWNRRKNGEIYPQWLTISVVRDEAGLATHYVGVFTDVSRIKSDEAKLERLTHYDALTGLPNRTLLLHRLEDSLQRARRTARRTAVLVIDLDGFKTVNDSLGHPSGDELLVCIAERLKARLRREDALGRLGGDEFLVTIEDLAEPADAALLARDLLRVISAPVPLACGRYAYLTASIGISIHPDDASEGAVELLRDADAALYRAKELGRNRSCFYTADMNAQAVAKLELEAALSQALRRRELLLHYQPKRELASGALVGAEALLRWQRDGEGLIPPGRFIPVAEQSSMILQIGGWVIDEACRQLRRWLDEGVTPVRIAVNVAARQFMAGDLDRVVCGALERHGVPARWLELELTEGMLVTDPQAAIDMMQRLRDLGVHLSLDDFGTGFSSLAYLQRFPIDTLKIDQSFVRDIGCEPGGAALVDAVIALAHRLQLRVVAEGVENAEQRDYLARQGCDEVQGYFIGMPGPAEGLRKMMAMMPMAPDGGDGVVRL